MSKSIEIRCPECNKKACETTTPEAVIKVKCRCKTSYTSTNGISKIN